MILVVVLVIIAVLGLVAASFSYRMNADMAAVRALYDLQQARMAAESGINFLTLKLRTERTDMDSWYDNAENYWRFPVYIPGGEFGSEGKAGSAGVADRRTVEGQQVCRFTIAAPRETSGNIDPTDVQPRWGVTDEAGKLNLNTATRGQLLVLFDLLQPRDGSGTVNSEELADALLDWIDDNRSERPNGAESGYYQSLNPRYSAKNGPLSSVEEILMIKGFNGQILFGEDYNRNGRLDANENDGPEGAFPPDNADGELDRGMWPYVTVYSWDWNRGNDNKLRADINGQIMRALATELGVGQAGSGAGGAGGAGAGGAGGAGGMGGAAAAAAGQAGGAAAKPIPEHLLEIPPEIVDFIALAQQRKYRFRSIGDLIGLEVYEDGSSNHDDMWEEYEQLVKDEDQARSEALEDEEEPDEGEEGLGPNEEGDGFEDPRDGESGEEEEGGRRGRSRAGREEQGGREDEDGSELQDDEDKNQGRRRQSIREETAGDEREPRGRRGRRGQENDRASGPQNGAGPGGNPTNPPGGNRGPDQRRSERESRRGRGSERRGPDTAPGEGDGKSKGVPIVSPVQAEHLELLMDRLTVFPVDRYLVLGGLINVNTASEVVLRTIPGLSEQDVAAIISTRSGLEGKAKLTPAWLATSQVFGGETARKFALISNLLTTRSLQYTADVVGFADHTGAFKRFQVVVEMRGQIAQFKYYRDISSLGVGYDVWKDELEQQQQ